MAKRKARYLSLGSISEGTLREADVIPALLDACATVRMTRDDRNTVRKLAAEFRLNAKNDAWMRSDYSAEMWNALNDILMAYAPPYCYVGAIEGDGACIGVWISDETLREAIDEGVVWNDPQDGTKMPHTASAPYRGSIPLEYYRLVTSDHGNMSLYDWRGREVW